VLHVYFEALEGAGLLVEALREPGPPQASVDADPAEARWARVPNFLFFRALKPPGKIVGLRRDGR
jgi:hypothetical protein